MLMRKPVEQLKVLIEQFSVRSRVECCQVLHGIFFPWYPHLSASLRMCHPALRPPVRLHSITALLAYEPSANPAAAATCRALLSGLVSETPYITGW